MPHQGEKVLINMKIALLGDGKMNRLIAELALLSGHEITARFSRTCGTLQDNPSKLESAEVAIDFSHSSAVLDHLDSCLSFGKPLVIGTTGWEEHLSLAKQKVKEKQGSCFFAPNFSIGIYLFQKIVSHAAALFQPHADYDVSGIEYHHQQKRDQPSGTAKALIDQLLQQMPRLKTLPFSSVRCGHIPGTHSLLFDSPCDTITLTHEARNRQGFAQGALLAAEWLLTRKGFFNLDDMMEK